MLFCFIPKRHVLYLLFLAVTLHPASSLGVSSKRCIEKEREALLHVNPACTYFNNTDWYPRDCCSWPGVYCSNRTGRIYRLQLASFLVGFCQPVDGAPLLNSSLLALEDLQDLDLVNYYSVFSGGLIPAFFGSFHKLRYLDLSYTWFTGPIPPQLGNFTRLQSLEIGQSYYGDGLYVRNLEWLSQLTLLKRLVLSDIDLSRARDWIHIVNSLPSLTYLDLHDTILPNSIPGHLPVSNSSKSLSFVDLSSNNLEASSLWTWLFNHTSIVELYLSLTQLRGPIPNGLGRMTSLSHLDLSMNQLEGWFSNSLHDLCKLQNIDLSRNKLAGDLVSFFQSLSCAQKSLASLRLQHNQLSGSVPDITKFTSLRKLTLHVNSLDGSFPSKFSTVSDLLILNLQANQLTGSVPDLSVFRSLKVLHLQNNRLNGSIHRGIGQLSSLVKLDFSSNSLNDQLFASHFSNLSSLRYLDMSFNSLRFNVSSDWVPPFRLETIGLAACGLGPSFPKWLQTQIDYSELDMFNATISDTIPPWFWNLSLRATFIGLSHNKLRGMLPNSSIVFDNNPAIDLSSNLLEGTIPSFLSNVQYLNLSRNSFSGSISFLCQRMRYEGYLFGLDLSHNFLSRKLPDCWMNLTINVMDLSNNNFFGSLPISLGSSDFVSLHLRNNRFSGKLPLSLGNLTRLIYLDLGGNQFSGEIPTSIGNNLPYLSVMSLRNNSFSGILTPKLCQLSSLQILDLSMNKIYGTIPNCLCNLTTMTQKKIDSAVLYVANGTFSSIGLPHKDHISLVWKGLTYEYSNLLNLVKIFDLSSNKLGGEIPREISCLTGLLSLNLSRNDLTGSITSKIGQLKDLEALDLSRNHLSGKIPSGLSSLNFLATLDLANNNLSGRIPLGTQIQGFNATVFEGNPELCGDPLPNKCPGDENSKEDDGRENSHNSDDEDETLGLYISIALGFITGFWAVCGTLVLKRSWRSAYFRSWIRAYDRLIVIIAVRMAAIQRKFQV